MTLLERATFLKNPRRMEAVLSQPTKPNTSRIIPPREVLETMIAEGTMIAIPKRNQVRSLCR